MDIIFGNLNVEQFEAIARERENEGKPAYKRRFMLDECGNILNNSAQVCVVITYEDVRGDEYEVTMLLPDDANIDEAVSMYVQGMPYVVWHSWRIADENDFAGGETRVLTSGASAANLGCDFDGDVVSVMSIPVGADLQVSNNEVRG
jgi:hypothetical protein